MRPAGLLPVRRRAVYVHVVRPAGHQQPRQLPYYNHHLRMRADRRLYRRLRLDRRGKQLETDCRSLHRALPLFPSKRIAEQFVRDRQHAVRDPPSSKCALSGSVLLALGRAARGLDCRPGHDQRLQHDVPRLPLPDADGRRPLRARSGRVLLRDHRLRLEWAARYHHYRRG